MKKVRFTEGQMVAILREADRTPVAEVAKKHKISEQTIYIHGPLPLRSCRDSVYRPDCVHTYGVSDESNRPNG